MRRRGRLRATGTTFSPAFNHTRRPGRHRVDADSFQPRLSHNGLSALNWAEAFPCPWATRSAPERRGDRRSAPVPTHQPQRGCSHQPKVGARAPALGDASKPRPTPTGRGGAQDAHESPEISPFIAPLNAALLVAARPVPPRRHGHEVAVLALRALRPRSAGGTWGGRRKG